MQALEGTQQLGGVESRAVDVEALLFLQMVEELSAIDESKDEI